MKKILISVISLMLCITCIGGVKRVSASSSFSHVAEDESNTMSLTEEQKEVLEKYNKVFIETGMYNEFSFDKNNKLTHQLNYEELKKKYKVTNDEIDFVERFVDYYNGRVSNISTSIQTRMTVKNFRIYLTYAETKNYLGAVATNGAIAVVGALAALGATVGGPLGAVISGLAGIYGANHIVETTKKALRQKKGIWLGWGGIGIH